SLGRDDHAGPRRDHPGQRRRTRPGRGARGQRPDRDARAARRHLRAERATRRRPVHPRCPLRPARRSPMRHAPGTDTTPRPDTSPGPAQASAPADAALRVILVDDENLIRSALATMLSLEADLDVRGEAATVADGLCLAEAVQPDVAVLDLQLPDGDGLEL